jgi:hypothetical protein
MVPRHHSTQLKPNSGAAAIGSGRKILSDGNHAKDLAETLAARRGLQETWQA